MPLFSRRRQSFDTSTEPVVKSLSAATAWVDLAPPSWGSRSYARLAEEGYRRNVVAHRCVRLVAECAASVPVKLARGERPAATDDPVLKLLGAPNPHEGGALFFETLYAHLQIGGNAFIEMIEDGAGPPRALYLLRPDRVTPVPGPGGWPEAYDYRVDGRVRRLPAMQADGRQPVLHLKQFHPLDDQMGLGAIDAAAYAIDLHNAATAWNKALLDNAARPSGALVFAPNDGQPATLSDDQLFRLKRELNEQYQGPGNAGRPLVLEGGLTWQAMALSPADMDFMAAKHGAARDIALAFGVPPMILGIPGDNTYANYQEANRAFWRLTLIPLIGRVLGQMARWLSLTLDDPVQLVPDLDAVPALAPEREALWARVANAPFLSDREKRRAVGFGPDPD
ncbi:MAG: phage portal protein [Rhodothalassiaceae bacterium]